MPLSSQCLLPDDRCIIDMHTSLTVVFCLCTPFGLCCGSLVRPFVKAVQDFTHAYLHHRPDYLLLMGHDVTDALCPHRSTYLILHAVFATSLLVSIVSLSPFDKIPVQYNRGPLCINDAPSSMPWLALAGRRSAGIIGILGIISHFLLLPFGHTAKEHASGAPLHSYHSCLGVPGWSCGPSPKSHQ